MPRQSCSSIPPSSCSEGTERAARTKGTTPHPLLQLGVKTSTQQGKTHSTACPEDYTLTFLEPRSSCAHIRAASELTLTISCPLAGTVRHPAICCSTPGDSQKCFGSLLPSCPRSCVAENQARWVPQSPFRVSLLLGTRGGHTRRHPSASAPEPAGAGKSQALLPSDRVGNSGGQRAARRAIINCSLTDLDGGR